MSKDYPLSMTGSSARKAESLITARLYLELRDWNAVRKQIVENNEYQFNALSSLKRVSNELIKRLKTLTDEEVEFFANSYGDNQLAMLWISICRTYPFLSGLSRNVIVDRYARMVPDFTPGAYEAYFDEEAEFHPELYALTEKSKQRMRNQVFQMLMECRLITESGRITPLYPSPAFTAAIDSEHREDLKLFPGVRLA